MVSPVVQSVFVSPRVEIRVNIVTLELGSGGGCDGGVALEALSCCPPGMEERGGGGVFSRI